MWLNRHRLRSAGRRLACVWAGPSGLPAGLRLEWQLTLVRWTGILCVPPGLLLPGLTMEQLLKVWAIVLVDGVYNAAVQYGLMRCPQRFASGLVTMIGDSVLTILAVSVGGGADSPISYAFFLVAVSAALRYGYRSLLVVALFVVDTGLEKTAGLRTIDAAFVIRSVFLGLTAVVTSYIYDAARRAETLLLRQELDQAAVIRQALEHQAQHDLLTGLPNRLVLRQRLREAFQVFEAGGAGPALLLMDLDRFKEINDTFGHHFGDLLLQQIGPRLRTVLGPTALLARLGGDEFAVLLPPHKRDTAAGVARELRSALEQPFTIGGYSVTIGVSIGIARLPDHGQAAEVLMQHADVAMYSAKRSGAGWAVYAPEQDEHSPDRIALAAELRQAIEQDQLVLHFQPMLDFQDGRPVGAEALVRWQHPVRGMVPPDQFISLAEATGLIRSLSQWVLNAAVREAAALARAGVSVPMSVNFSMRDLRDAELPDVIERTLKKWSLAPAQLKIEITESSLMDDPVGALQVLTRLSLMGVQIAIDDFGTGYSSLSYLKHLPVTDLKIDRSFVQHLVTDPRDAAIVRATVSLGHELGLNVVAEGIETDDTWQALHELGCDMAQGYLISRPITAAALTSWLRQHKERSLASARAA